MGGVKEKTIVDLGGGLSVNCIILANKGAQVVVADISINRLKILKQIIQRCGFEDRILLVCTTAEDMAFADESIDIVQTKSVLIHTQIAAALAEIKRVLKHEGTGYFIEPTTGNPFANLYRMLLAPKEWKSITHYFNKHTLATIRETFPRSTTEPFYLLGFGAFIWQFGIRKLSIFKKSLQILGTIDNMLYKLYGRFSSYAWFQAIEVKKYPGTRYGKM
jgi:ubiquinone/menaquinone biosynthesis C-methylase UbiE